MKFYFGTILLEANRWKKDKPPIYNPALWLDRIGEAGFSGLELWENHVPLFSDEERDRLKNAFPGNLLFNTYDRFGNETAGDRDRAAKRILGLGAAGTKFNLGPDPEKLSEYLENFRAWTDKMPGDFRFICECHAGTICEEPERAAEVFEALNDKRIEALVHLKQSPDTMKRWVTCMGERLTHVHANYMRTAGDVWTNPDTLEYDFRESLRLAGTAPLKTVTLEFTRGVGEENEDRGKLFTRALRDRDMIKKAWNL